jgi:hypothetical protein
MKRKKITVTSKDLESRESVGRRARPSSKSKSLEYPNYHEEQIQAEKNMFKPIADILGNPDARLLTPAMLESSKPEDYPVITDPFTGMKVHARITEVNWLESAKVKRKGEIVESVRKMRLTPDKFKEAIHTAKKNLRESKRNKEGNERLSEDYDFGGYSSSAGYSSNTGLPTGEYLPYPPGPLTKNQYLQNFWEANAKAFQIYNLYGLAHGAINIMSAFVVGDGVGVEAEDEKAQEIWDEFEKRTQFQPRLYQQAVQLSKLGELMWHVPGIQVGHIPGFTDFISKDPGTCWEIITEPSDIRDIKAYYFNYPTQYQIVTKDSTPLTDYIVEYLPPEEILHVKVNVEDGEKRGRSDLLSVLSDLKMLKDIMRYRAIKVMNAAGIIIDRKIKGDDTDVSRVAALSTGFMGPGTEYTHNESEEVSIMSAAEGEGRKSGLQEEMVSQIGTGAGLPADYLGTGGSGSRAAALTRTEPAAKLFLTRQIQLENPIVSVFKRVIQNAKLGGRLSQDVSEECEVTFPEVAPENQKDKVATLKQGLTDRAITHKEYVSMFRTELKINKAYTYEELQEEIKAERLKDPILMAAMDPMAAGIAGPGNPNVDGKEKSRGAYNGDKMGLSNDSKNSIKSSLESKRKKS